ncbi:11631_t:CDS:2 [Ambispora gerdemannii]|uniref:11631_t:CDS:1 n=1 Tax=Ambispora gerdemannii TaxID=144530 RepID=A0A9N9E4I0_9GLOM|nr:11631_t:CDS:2 [Ambispora gerdemannii]
MNKDPNHLYIEIQQRLKRKESWDIFGDHYGISFDYLLFTFLVEQEIAFYHFQLLKLQGPNDFTFKHSFSVIPSEPASKKKCNHLSNAQRKEICEYSQKNPSAKHHEITEEFLTVIWLTVFTEKTYHHRSPKYLLVKAIMNLWVDQINANAELVLTNVLLKKKAHTFVEGLGIDKEAQKFSNGWLKKFKKRNNIRKIMLHGEANSASLALLPEARIILQAIISGYDLDNVYNVDETGLFSHNFNTNIGKEEKSRN